MRRPKWQSRRSKRSASAAEREGRRLEAVDEALRLLERRDLSRAELERRLGQRGIDGRDAASAASALVRSGVVDDGRSAHVRSAALAERGWGDEGIRFKLEHEGFAEPAISAALESLQPEAARARGIVARRGASRRTFAYLAARGFGEDTLEAAGSLQLAD